MRGLGTAVNVATVLVGTGVGVLAGPRLPGRLRITVLQGIGLATIALGLANAAQPGAFGLGKAGPRRRFPGLPPGRPGDDLRAGHGRL